LDFNFSFKINQFFAIDIPTH